MCCISIFTWGPRLPVGNAFKALLAVAIIVCCVAFLWLQGRPPKGSGPKHEYVGTLVGRELVKLRGEKGGKILIIGYAGERRTLNQQVDGFTDEIKKHAGFELLAREDIDPSASGELMETGVPSAAFAGLVRVHKDADIVVSFVGLPDFRDAGVVSLFSSGRQLVAVNARSPDLPELVRQGVVCLAIVNKFPGPDDPAKAAPTPAEWFDHFFRVVTADTAKAN